MSILIHGMDMPKNCRDCPCYHQKRDNGYYDYEICRASGTIFNDSYSSVTGHKDLIDPFKARLDNCPLAPVPPHGRLIDADALMEHCVDLPQEGGYMPIVYKSYITNAPTIIEAEGSGEGERKEK